MIQFKRKWKELQRKCQINRHTNCRFFVIRACHQSIPQMPFFKWNASLNTISTCINGRFLWCEFSPEVLGIAMRTTSSVSVYSYIHNQQRNCSFNCVDFGPGETSWQTSLWYQWYHEQRNDIICSLISRKERHMWRLDVRCSEIDRSWCISTSICIGCVFWCCFHCLKQCCLFRMSRVPFLNAYCICASPITLS